MDPPFRNVPETLMIVLLSTTTVAGPGEDAQTRLEALGPHVATYVKESTGEQRLTLHYHSPQEGALIAQNEDGVYRFSVDATHIRIAVDDACASIPYQQLYQAAEKVSMGLDDEPAQPRLNFRASKSDSVDMGASFMVSHIPLLYSWHADLEEDGVVLEMGRKTWTAELGESSWTLDAKRGLLQRMTVGTEALVLQEVVRGKKASPINVRSVCPTTTSIEIERPFTDLVNIASILVSYSVLVSRWEDLPPEKQTEAIARMRAWWTGVIEDDLAWYAQQWVTAHREDLMSQIGDSSAFLTFREERLSEPPADVIAAWKTMWYQEASQLLLQHYGAEVVNGLTTALLEVEKFDDTELRDPLLLKPLRTALVSDAEPAFQKTLQQVVDEATTKLQAP